MQGTLVLAIDVGTFGAPFVLYRWTATAEILPGVFIGEARCREYRPGPASISRLMTVLMDLAGRREFIPAGSPRQHVIRYARRSAPHA